MTNNLKRGFTDAIGMMQKQSAFKYTFGDLWTGLGAASAKTLKSFFVSAQSKSR